MEMITMKKREMVAYIKNNIASIISSKEYRAGEDETYLGLYEDIATRLSRSSLSEECIFSLNKQISSIYLIVSNREVKLFSIFRDTFYGWEFRGRCLGYCYHHLQFFEGALGACESFLDKEG